MKKGTNQLAVHLNSEPVYTQAMEVVGIAGEYAIFQITERQYATWLSDDHFAIFLGFAPSLSNAMAILAYNAERARLKLPGLMQKEEGAFRLLREQLKRELEGDDDDGKN